LRHFLDFGELSVNLVAQFLTLTKDSPCDIHTHGMTSHCNFRNPSSPMWRELGVSLTPSYVR